MNTIKKQKGMTGAAILLVIVLVAFFANIGIRLFPVYMEHFSVATHLNRLAEDESVKTKTNAEIYTTLFKRFSIDGIKTITEENIFIERNKDKSMIIAIEYEVRTPAIGNVDMFISFVDEVTID